MIKDIVKETAGKDAQGCWSPFNENSSKSAPDVPIPV
jgi:hypothetical protein